jgi:nickel transport protein
MVREGTASFKKADATANKDWGTSGYAAGILAIFFFFAIPAMAHKVNIFAYVENGTVYTESYFPDGKMVAEGSIEVLGSDGKKVVEGRTDNDGRFSFPLPEKKENLTIVINATMGHKNSFILKTSEM